MKRKIYLLATVLLIAMLAITPVYAGGISGGWGLGSIKFDGTAWGFGKDATVYIVGAGYPLVNCYAPGSSNPAPGQNPSKVYASASQPASDNWLGKGKFDIHLSADANFDDWTAEAAGCPNDNWTFQVYFVNWDEATITVINSKDNTRHEQTYSCTTTYTGVDYNNTPDDTFDDGTIICTPS